MKVPAVSIIGTGALGSTLAKAFKRQEIQIKSIYNRSSEKSRSLAEKLKIGISGSFPEEVEELGRLIFITVPDDSTGDTAAQLAQLSDEWDGYFVMHCSGNEPSAVLSPLRKKGAETAAFHPLQTFTWSSSPEAFKGIYFSLQGDENLLALLEKIAQKLGAETFRISPEAKSYLHASAVMASNYLVALLHASGQIAEIGGIEAEKAGKALLPLVRQSLENAGSGDLAAALSGPVTRGDIGTIRRHLELIKSDADLLLLYKQLGKQALKLAKKKGTLNSVQVSELENLLSS